MKHIIALQLFFIYAFSQAQNHQISKIVVDKNTKFPLENVIIFNEIDYSTTNANGKFIFVSQMNEINLNLFGYDAINTTFDKLKNSKDTIFMEMKATQLKEVFVSNADTYIKKVYDKLKDNLLQNYTVNFFLRNEFKKENVYIHLQDIYARKSTTEGQKKNLAIEILNMRKVYLFEKKENIKIISSSFKRQFISILPQIDKCNFTEIPFNDSTFKKVLFESNEEDIAGQILKGYFIICRKDYAIVAYSVSIICNPEKKPYNILSNSRGKYRTIKWTKFLQFTKDVTSNKYYLSNSKFDAQNEMFIDKISKDPFYYDFKTIFFTTNNPTNEKIKPNFPADKEISKAKFPYSKDFWDNQNQLPLTHELELFLKSLNEKKDNTKEFEVIGNF